MTTEQKKQQAIFPDLPRDSQMVDRDGNITSPWRLYFEQQAMALQTNYKPEGIVVPPKPASEIAQLGNASQSFGNIIYDSTNNAFKGILVVSINPPVTITKTFTLT